MPAKTLDEIIAGAHQAVAEGIEILLVAGGDGTLSAVAGSDSGYQNRYCRCSRRHRQCTGA